MSKVRGKRKPAQPPVEAATAWPRADPEELAKFDDATKRCSMNCGKSSLDPRSYKELRFLCDECYTRVPAPPSPEALLLAEAVEVLQEVIDLAEAGETLGSETTWRAERVLKGRRIYVDGRALSTATDFNLPGDDAVQVPRVPTVEMLVAISHAMGVTPLGDGSDGSYPITGRQSTARQVYEAITAKAGEQ